MDVEKSCIIPFRGLKPGVYTYDFKVDNTLFEAYESTEIKRGECDVRVELRRLESMLDMQIQIAGAVVVPCDRCLDDCQIAVAFEGNLVVKFSDEVREYDGEVMWLSPKDDEVDLTQYIYESIVLSLPYQRVHPDSECDPEMLKRFRIVSDEEFRKIEAEAEKEPSSALSEQSKESLAALRQKLEQEAKTKKQVIR